jgi:hypothetical protein
MKNKIATFMFWTVLVVGVIVMVGYTVKERIDGGRYYSRCKSVCLENERITVAESGWYPADVCYCEVIPSQPVINKRPVK